MQVSFDMPKNASISLVVLNRLQLGIAVTDAMGSVLFANAHALALFGAADVVARGAAGRLHFADGGVDGRFRRALRQIASGKMARESATAVFVLQRARKTQLPLVVAICALESRADCAQLLVTFADAADALSTTTMRPLAECFGLTPAEQRLVQYLASGGRLSGAAKEFGVSPHTVRNQLRAVFEKSGVQRQVDLTRLVMTGGAANLPTMPLQQHSHSGRETSHAFL